MLQVDNYYQDRLGGLYELVREDFLCFSDGDDAYLRSDFENFSNNAYFTITTEYCGEKFADSQCSTYEEIENYWQSHAHEH